MSRQIHIIHVTTGLATGGAEHSLLSLLSGLGEPFSASVVSLTSGGAVGERIVELGIPVHSLGMKRGRLTPGAALRLASLLRTLRPAVVQGWMYHGNLAAWAARLLAWLDSPLAWNVRHTPGDLRDEKLLTRTVIRSGALVSRAPGAIVYNSWSSAHRHEELGYSAQRRRVIPNGFDTGRFRPRPDIRARMRSELRLGEASVAVALVARYHPIKDHASFLQAARIMANRSEDARFVLVGRGVDAANSDLVQEIEALGLTDRVRLLGERSDVAEILAACDVACLASRGEGLPNVVGEAMACGLPCVVTDVGDAGRIVGDTGEVVPPGAPSALANGLVRLVFATEDERRRLGELARKRIVHEFGFQRMIERYDHLYRELNDVRLRRIRPARSSS